ncbi:MAG: S-layer homology domain-containing protein [Lachnospiraceae bacterium]|nr:S-layer homology domain-containing protein [Lachnospiraceae bacterium]
MKNVILRLAASLAAMFICTVMIPAIVRADEPGIDDGFHSQLDFKPGISNYEELLEVLPQVEHLEPTGNILFIPVAQMDADITIGEGQRIDTPGSIATEGYTLTIENGGYIKSSFFNNPGGQIIIKAGGELHVSGGEYSTNLGTIIVEGGGHLQCEKSEDIINNPQCSMVIDGVYCVGSYIGKNPDQPDIIHEGFDNQGAVSGSGYAVAMPVESETGYLPPEKTLIAANKIRAQLATDTVRVLAAAGSPEDFAALSQMEDIDGFYLQSSDSGKFYLPTNATRSEYICDGWTISSPLKGTDAWTSEMEDIFASISVKEDSSGTYVEALGTFPLIILPEWTLPPTPTPTPKPASGFSDVQNPKHPYYNAIYWAANAGITKGYPDGTFGIDRDCTRGEMMMFLWRYAGKKEPKAVSKSPFKDVPKTHTFYKAILWGSQKGITKGYPDGTFGVNRNVTRGECMMFLWRLKGKPAPKAVAKAPFPDVPKSHVFYNAVLWGYQKKITTGFKDGKLKGKFGVDANCTRGQIVTFLYRAR